ncbi:hypothetical protein [Neolewinella persica]|uniref:hypothetical protein n=1 Tax=Neolewinella persica TaxID=70998 RepID=UPI0003A93DC0|nr:hypothetical protein [Neolewinella persica]
MDNQSAYPTGTIKSVLRKMKQSSGPVTEELHAVDGLSVMVIGLNRGELLADHTTDVKTRLIVLDGCVLYNDPIDTFPLFDYDEHEIPIGVVHSLTANRKSICLLIKG